MWCMVPEIWSATDRIFLSFCNTFSPTFTPLWAQKIKIWKKWKEKKNTWRYYHFTEVYHKWQSIIWCMVPEIWSITEKIVCHFGPFFPVPPPPPHNNPKIQSFEKLKKTPGDIIILSVSKILIICYTVP